MSVEEMWHVIDFLLNISRGLGSTCLDSRQLSSIGRLGCERADGGVVAFSTWIAINVVRNNGASCIYLRTAELPHLHNSKMFTVTMPALASISAPSTRRECSEKRCLVPRTAGAVSCLPVSRLQCLMASRTSVLFRYRTVCAFVALAAAVTNLGNRGLCLSGSRYSLPKVFSKARM